MTRRGLLGFSGAILAAAAAAAWAGGVVSAEPSAPKGQAQPAPPSASLERIFVSESQLLHARATGAVHREVRSLLNISKPMRHGEFNWNDKNVAKGPVWVRVDLDNQLISVFRSGHEIGTAVILFGAEEKRSPAGVFPILAKLKDHHSSIYDAEMPYTLRLTDDGVAIHGSEVTWGAATHGCIGVPLEFARRLFDEVSAGDQVAIVASRSPNA